MANSFALRQKVRYNSEDFPRYFRQLRGLCLKLKGAWILNKLVTNPIDKFICSIKELNAENGTGGDSETPTPQKQSHKSKEEAEVSSTTTTTRRAGTSEKREDTEQTSSPPFIDLNGPVHQTHRTIKHSRTTQKINFYEVAEERKLGNPILRQKLKDELCDWISAEGII